MQVNNTFYFEVLWDNVLPQRFDDAQGNYIETEHQVPTWMCGQGTGIRYLREHTKIRLLTDPRRIKELADNRFIEVHTTIDGQHIVVFNEHRDLIKRLKRDDSPVTDGSYRTRVKELVQQDWNTIVQNIEMPPLEKKSALLAKLKSIFIMLLIFISQRDGVKINRPKEDEQL